MTPTAADGSSPISSPVGEEQTTKDHSCPAQLKESLEAKKSADEVIQLLMRSRVADTPMFLRSMQLIMNTINYLWFLSWYSVFQHYEVGGGSHAQGWVFVIFSVGVAFAMTFVATYANELFHSKSSNYTMYLAESAVKLLKLENRDDDTSRASLSKNLQVATESRKNLNAVQRLIGNMASSAILIAALKINELLSHNGHMTNHSDNVWLQSLLFLIFGIGLLTLRFQMNHLFSRL
jgi:hypothetical protein